MFHDNRPNCAPQGAPQAERSLGDGRCIGQTSGAARRHSWLGTTPLGLEVALLKVS